MVSIVAHAQNAGYRIMNFGSNEGLSQGTVRDIVQDAKGFLWVGTADGLNRFDGYSFKAYRPDTGNLSVRYLLLQDSILWVTTTTKHAIYRFNIYTERMTEVFSYIPLISYAKILILSASGDTVTFAATGLGIVTINWRTGKTISRKSEVSNICPNQNTLVSDKYHRMWYWTTEGELYCYNQLSRQFSDLPSALRDKAMIGMSAADDSCLWFTTRRGIICFNPGSLAVETYPVSDSLVPGTKFEISGRPYELDSAFMLCCTDRGGVLVFNRKERRFLQPEENFFRNVPKNLLHFFFKDRTGNLWISADPYGLYKANLKEKPFHTIMKNANDHGGLGSNFIKSIFQQDDELLIGTYDNGISVMNLQSRKFRYITDYAGNRDYPPCIFHICKAPGGDIFVLHRDGITVLDEHTHKKYPLAQQLDSPAALKLSYSVLFLKDSTILVGQDQGLLILRKSNKGYRVTVMHELSNTTCILQDSKGRIWACSGEGLWLLTQKDGSFLRENVISNKGIIKHITEGGNGIFWVGAEHGLLKFDANRKQIVRTYDDRDGMIDHFVYCVLPDAFGNLWMSTNKGICKFNISSGLFRNYTSADGLQNGEFNTGSYYTSKKGEFFFGGVNGFNHFYPREITDNPNKPVSVITSFKIFDTTYHTDSAIEYKKVIHLNYTQNILSFEYAGLEFSDPAKNTYAYQLVGVDDKWIMAGTKRFARYANMAAGDYVFRVKAANEDGIWGDPATLSITISPPFWQMWWFRSFMILAGGALLYLVIRYVSTRKLQKHLRELEMNQKIQQERLRISRDLHDNVGSQLSYIISNVDAEERGDKRDVGRMNAVRDIARSTMENLRETIWALNNEYVSCEDFSDKLRKFLSLQLEFRSAPVLQWEASDCDRMLTPVQALNLYRIAQEAINNALKYSFAEKLKVRVQAVSGVFTVSIIDNGRGFDCNSPQEGEHYGLKNIRYRAEEINARLHIASAPGEGTNVTIELD